MTPLPGHLSQDAGRPPAFQRAASWLRRTDEVLATRAAAISLAALFLYGIAEALRRKMWVDELYSYYVVNQPTVRDLLRSLLEGCDNSPPLYALLVHWLRPVLGTGAFALRVPAVAGFVAACACVFVFVHRRLPAMYALAAMLIAARAMLHFSLEGRPYGLVLACAGIALVAWQTAALDGGPRRRWPLVALGVSLAIGIALHYYTVFLLIPFLAAEVARWRISGKLDRPLLLALLTPPLALILNWPFIHATERFLRYFWSKQDFPFTSYYLFLGKAGYLPMIVALLVPVGVWLYRPWNPGSSGPGGKRGFSIPEWTCIVTLTVMPYVVLALAFITRIFQDRYVLWGIMGLSILVAALLFRLVRGELWPAAALSLLLAAVLTVKCFSALAAPALLYEGEPVKRVLTSVLAGPEPIVIADHHVFLELTFYSASPLRDRLVYLPSPELERHYTRTDTGPLLLSALAHRTNLHIYDYDSFLKSHRRFFIAAGPEDWMPKQLRATSYALTPLRSEPTATLFEVTQGTK